MLDHIANPKHLALITIVHSAGLRVAEAVRLKVADIDASRRLILVRAGKGRKDRYTILAETAWKVLQHHLARDQPVTWLFPAPGPTSTFPCEALNTLSRALKPPRG